MQRSGLRMLTAAVVALVATTAGSVLVQGQPPTNSGGRPTPGRPAVEHRAEATLEYTQTQKLPKSVTLAKLSNGMTVLVQENHTAPVATVRCYVDNTGSAYEGKYLGMGISHLLEHLVAGGSTTNRTEKEISNIIDTLGGQTNAYTSNNVTAYYINCPSKKANVAIELIADSMQNAAIPEDEYRRELGVVQRELEMGESQRLRVGYQAMKELVFTRHATRVPIIGYLQVLQGVTRQDVLDFYKGRYAPHNMVFVVVGDIQTEEILKEIQQRFATFVRRAQPEIELGEEPNQASPRSTRIEMPGSTVDFAVAWPTVMLQHPDLYALDVASYLLATGDSSRLGRRLKLENPLAVSVSSASYTPGFVKGWFQVGFRCDPDNLSQCRAIVQEEIQRLKTELVDTKELAKVKRQKAAEHVFGQLTVEAQAESLARSYLATGDPLFDDQYVTGIQEVTPEQVQEVVRKYFRPERQNTVVIVPPGTPAQTVAQGRQTGGETDIIREELPNGLVVLLKRQPNLPIVSLQAFVKGGVLVDTPQKAGLATLATETMSRGTKKYTAQQIAEYFDSIGGSLTTASQRNTSYLQASVLSDDFETAFDYAYQVLFEPTFPQQEFQKVQEIHLDRIAARAANPQTEIFDFWTSHLPATSPYSRTVQGTAETVSRLTVNDAKQYHRRFFVPNNMVLAIFGDIDPEKTLATIKRTFGAVPKSEEFSFPEFAVVRTPQAEDAPEAVNRLANQQPDTSMVMIGYPVSSVHAREQQATLRMISAVLTGGGGAGGRLFEELRGNRLVYYVFGIELGGLAPGYFVFMAQTRPETSQEVVERIQANLAKIVQEGIPEEEFERSRQKLIAAHSLRNTTPGEQAFQAALNELYGLGYDYDESFDQRIGQVTVDDVQELIKRYFRGASIAISQPELEKAGATP